MLAYGFEARQTLVIVDLFQAVADECFCVLSGVDFEEAEHVILVDDVVEDVEHLVVDHPFAEDDQDLPLGDLGVELLLQEQQDIEHVPGRLDVDELLVDDDAVALDVLQEVVLEHPGQQELALPFDELDGLLVAVEVLEDRSQILDLHNAHHFLIEWQRQLYVVEHGHELVDVVLLPDLQPLAEPVDDDLDEGLVRLLELGAHLLHGLRQQLDLHRRAVLGAHELGHHAVEQGQLQVVAGHKRLLVQCPQLAQNQIVLLLVAEEE